ARHAQLALQVVQPRGPLGGRGGGGGLPRPPGKRPAPPPRPGPRVGAAAPAAAARAGRGVARPWRLRRAGRLARAPDPDARTDGGDRADRAARRDRLADVLAEGDEQIVVADPVASRQPPPQRHLPLLGIPPPDQAPEVADR